MEHSGGLCQVLPDVAHRFRLLGKCGFFAVQILKPCIAHSWFQFNSNTFTWITWSLTLALALLVVQGDQQLASKSFGQRRCKAFGKTAWSSTAGRTLVEHAAFAACQMPEPLEAWENRHYGNCGRHAVHSASKISKVFSLSRNSEDMGTDHHFLFSFNEILSIIFRGLQ